MKAACPLALDWCWWKLVAPVSVNVCQPSPASPAQADRRQSLTQGYTPPGVHTALATPAPPRGFNTTHKLTKRSFEMATSCILSHFGWQVAREHTSITSSRGATHWSREIWHMMMPVLRQGWVVKQNMTWWWYFVAMLYTANTAIRPWIWDCILQTNSSGLVNCHNFRPTDKNCNWSCTIIH